MNETLKDVFKDIEYAAVTKIINDTLELLQDVYSSDKYHDEWLKGVFDGIVKLSDIFIGEVYKDDDTYVKHKYEELKEHMKSDYVSNDDVLITSLLSLIAMSDYKLNIDNIKNQKVKKKTVDVAYM